jgi:hypothetical protein
MGGDAIRRKKKKNQREADSSYRASSIRPQQDKRLFVFVNKKKNTQDRSLGVVSENDGREIN